MDDIAAMGPLLQLVARARANRIKRQAQESSDPGSQTTEAASATGDPHRKETHDAISL